MDEETENPQIRPARINFADVLMAGATFLKGVSEAAHDAWEIIEISYAAHSQYIMEKQQFERTVGREIESLTEVQDG